MVQWLESNQVQRWSQECPHLALLCRWSVVQGLKAKAHLTSRSTTIGHRRMHIGTCTVVPWGYMSLITRELKLIRSN
jgi:hypothetical protein